MASRLIEAVNLEADEALLTGESLPVAKTSHSTFDKDVGAGDRLNIAFSSSTITKGRANGVVIATVSIVAARHPTECYATCEERWPLQHCQVLNFLGRDCPTVTCLSTSC